MGIQSIRPSLQDVVIGTIRLGTKVETRSGGTRPTNLDHFNLTDAPLVAEKRFISSGPNHKEGELIYGDKPKAIDILLPDDDLDKVAPAWLKLYGNATKDRDGNIIGGRLKCMGDGPNLETGTPGTAQWFDKKDPLTGIVPTRPCLGEKCPDWKDAKGNQVCGPILTMICMIPLISYDGLFKISTGSWHSIRQILSTLHFLKSTRGTVKMLPLQIVREEEAITYTDPQGNQKTNTHSLLRLRANPDFFEHYAAEIQGRFEALKNNNFGYFLASHQQDLLEEPVGRALALSPADQEAEQVAAVQSKVEMAEAIINDPEVKALLDRVDTYLRTPLGEKERKMRARKYENSPDPKAALIAEIQKFLNEKEAKRQASATPTKTAEPVATVNPVTGEVVDAVPAEVVTAAPVQPVQAASAQDNGLM